MRTVRYDLETPLYRAPQHWPLVRADLQSLRNVNLFKSKIKHLECSKRPCKLCKAYLKNICLTLCLTFPQNQFNSAIKL